MSEAQFSVASAHALAIKSFLRRFRTEILAEWRRLARDIPIARDMTGVSLVDHLPELLDEISSVADQLLNERALAMPDAARRHAVDRLGAGFDVSAVVHELSLLRRCILTVWNRENERSGDEVIALNLAVDRAVAASVSRYAEARERTLTAIDDISTAALEAPDLDTLLRRLLSVFKATTQAVDTGAILLVGDDGRLHVRAMVGLEHALEREASLEVGEGFAGRIAHERKPQELQAAYLDPTVESEALRRKGVRALYGVPLIHGERLIGVAHMGSATAPEFSSDDRHLFDSMAARATIGIYQHLLRDELVRSEAALQDIASERTRALARLESLLQGSPIGIAFLDHELRYVRINAPLAAIDGRPVSEHIGRSIGEMLPAIAPMVEPILRRILDTGEPVVNLEVAGPPDLPSHRDRSFLATLFPVRAPTGALTGVGGIVVEITELRHAQDELRTAIRARDDVLAVVSHDLRSPLGTVQLSATKLLIELAPDARARKHLEMIQRATIRMEHLIDDLLDTASIGAGQLALELAPEPVESVLAETRDLQEPIALDKQITLELASDAHGIDVLCDRGRVLQVLENLISNAVKFCRPGDTILIGCEPAGEHVQLSVVDSGPGVDPSLVPYLFEPYWSAPQHRQRGTGLGLYIAKGIVERHGGRIWVETRYGAGATFSFTLPIAR
jgi:signal transduction histidine kinase